MIYRRFGRTDLEMPVFSCGGMRYQDAWQDKSLDQVDDDGQANLEATIHRSVEVGINHIETARGYGSSERQLGRVLPKLPREKIIVQTKIGPDDDPDKFEAHFGESLERLQLDHVDLLAVHGINDRKTLEQSIRPGGCFERSQKIRDAGKARFIGFSTHGPLDVILDAIKHGPARTGAGFDYVNLHWYYIFQHNWPAIEEATRRDMGVFIISPSDKGGMLYKPSQKLVELCRPLAPIAFNDLFCLTHEQVHTLSVGAARPSDFDEHVDSLAYYDDAPELLPPIRERLQIEWDSAVERPIRNPFACGIPEPDQVPGGINVRVILWLRGLAKAYDMTEYAKMRYNLLGNGGHWFPGYKADRLDEDGVEAQLRDKLEGWGVDADLVVRALREAHRMLAGEGRKRLSQSEG